MRTMTIDETMKVNAGYWYCKICGYQNDSRGNVYYHIFENHELPYVSLILAVLAFA